jgi:hypothetical protein
MAMQTYDFSKNSTFYISKSWGVFIKYYFTVIQQVTSPKWCHSSNCLGVAQKSGNKIFANVTLWQVNK